MPNENIMQQQQPKQQVMEVKQVRQHLTDMQRWNETPGKLIWQQRKEYAEQIIEYEKVHGERYLQMVQQRMQAANAAGVADNARPIQQQPAQETWKARRRRERRTREANERCPGADHISLDISEKVTEGYKCHKNSMEDNNAYERAEELGVDRRVLANFTYGYRQDKSGNPLTEMDALRKEEDEKYINDYLSCNLERRRKHLDRMMKQLSSYSEMFSTRDHFTIEYIRDHAVQAYNYSNHLTYLENVMKDPINLPYFRGLSKEQKDRLDIMMHGGQNIATYFSTLGGMKGVNMNSGELMEEVSRYFEEQMNGNEYMPGGVRAQLENTLVQRNRMQKRFEEKRADAMLKVERGRLMAGGTEVRQKAEKMVADDYQGLKLTSFATGFTISDLAKYRKLIEENLEKYQQNKEIIDKLYQGLHHGVDSLGDLTCTSLACQKILDDIPNNTYNKEDKRIRKNIYKKMEAEAERIDLIRDHLRTYKDALYYLLKNIPLSASAESLLRNLGHIV